MTTINLNGYDVHFPYSSPYDIQKIYMEKVLTCLDKRTHAVLESPTGTGKTLCLFAPITAWAKQKKLQTRKEVHVVDSQQEEFTSSNFNQNGSEGNWGKKSFKIWYTSRTHSQIAQTIGEVRKCDTEGLSVRVMGARDQLCINNDVLEEKDSYIKTVRCRDLVKSRQCRYFNKLNQEKDFLKYYHSDHVLDIEDLVSLGKSNGICPYYLAKKAVETADIVLLPYNYIIDKDARESNGFCFQNDVIIFDEGHNTPSTCEESFEIAFSSLDIAIGIKNMKEVMSTLSNLTDSLEDIDIDIKAHTSNSIFIMKMLQKLEADLEELPVSKELLPVSTFYNFFERAGITYSTSQKLIDGIQQFKNDSSLLTLSGSTLETFKLLEKIMNLIFGQAIRSFDDATIDRSFKCGISLDTERPNNVKKFSLYCFNPSFGIRNLLQLGVKSIIVTSGTLSPLKTFIHELALPDPITLENGHIAKKCQVPFVILGTGVNNVRMDGCYKNRKDPKYIVSLGMTLTNLITSIPDGVLLLFSSYSMMQNLREAWDTGLGVWARLSSLKRVFVEPREKNEFINCVENYKRAIDTGNGAILMGVLRGKISEGMDFKDQYCRGVFIIGVPFPPVQDPRVQGKEKYSESLVIRNPTTKTEEKLYNNSFMSVEAMKVTNQAIGRVIRHAQDYGVIILVDYRFASPRLFSYISSWLRGEFPVERNFPETKKIVRDFFKNIHLGRLGVEEIRHQKVDPDGCPVPGYIKYEEYNHKKQASLVSWIGGNQTQKSKTQKAKRRGHSDIKYEDEDSPDLVSMYSLYKTVGTTEMSNENTKSESNDSVSLLDALENVKSSSVGYREFDKNNMPGNSKRKLEEDEYPDQNSSQSLLSFPELPQGQKKFSRLKIRPLIPFDKGEEPGIPDDTLAVSSEPGNKEDLKVKLINYFKEVKQFLSKEHDQKFKNISCKYMKGEAQLTEVIESMDELFLSPGKKNLFSEFSVCVKVKDKDEWMKACSRREIQLS